MSRWAQCILICISLGRGVGVDRLLSLIKHITFVLKDFAGTTLPWP